MTKTRFFQKYARGVKGAPMGCTKLDKNGKTYISLKKLEKNPKISYCNIKIYTISHETSLVAAHQMCPYPFVTPHCHRIPCHSALPPHPTSFITRNSVPSIPTIENRHLQG